MMSASIKLVLTGDPDVGKTSLIHRFIGNSLAKEYLPTLGFQIFMKSILLNNIRVDFQIWDVGGGQSFRFVRKNYYTRSQGFIMVFDLGKAESLQNLETWLAEIREVLVGNKADIPVQRISVAEINAKCDLWGTSGKTLTSAKTGSNVKEAFLILGQVIIANLK